MMDKDIFLALFLEFIPNDATTEHHLIFADYLEELGELLLAKSMRYHSRSGPWYTRRWLTASGGFGSNSYQERYEQLIALGIEEIFVDSRIKGVC